MKKIISLFTVLCIAVLLASCNSVHTSISAERPSDKKVVEVEVEDYGNNAYFVTKKELTAISVNKMLYDKESANYVVDETVYTKKEMGTDECLKIVLDLEQKMPYVMIAYNMGGKKYEQFLYKNPETGKMLLLELEQ